MEPMLVLQMYSYNHRFKSILFLFVVARLTKASLIDTVCACDNSLHHSICPACINIIVLSAQAALRSSDLF